MYKLNIPGLALPPCIVCETVEDATACRVNGLPYLKKPDGWSDAKLVGCIMYHMLKDKLPYVDWEGVLGLVPEDPERIIVMSPGDEDGSRTTTRSVHDGSVFDDWQPDGTLVHDIGGGEGYIWGDDEAPIDEEEELEWSEHSLDEFYREAVDHVDMVQLQELGLLPQFLSDITESVKRNIIGTSWMDGWNRKLGAAIGEFKYSQEAPNLIVIDVSGSIPYGISYTMVTLMDMLRTQANADLIITGDKSYYYKCDEEIPNPERFSGIIGYCNEASMFNRIIEDHVLGRTWGNVIVFGDMHAPNDKRFLGDYQIHDDNRRNTVVNQLLCYDTRGKFIPGYALWALPHVDDANVQLKGSDWTTYMVEHPR